MAIEHNDFVALTTNRQTVLNILRAREREPMHFTSFQLVSGKVQGTGQIGLNTALNGDGGSLATTNTMLTRSNAAGELADRSVTEQVVDTLSRGATNWTPSAQVSVQTGTDFQIAVNATEEFYRGILGSLSPGIVIHYLRQGFPRDLLTHLVVGRIEVFARVVELGRDPRLVSLGTINNAPDEADEIALFAAAVRCRELGYRVTSVAASRMPVPLTTLAGVDAAVLARLRAVSTHEGIVYELHTPARNEFSLTLASPREGDCRTFQRELVERLNERASLGEVSLRPSRSVEEQVNRLQPDRSAIQAEPASQGPANPEAQISEGVTGAGGATFNDANYFDRLLVEGVRGDLVVEVTLRSVEGIIYYLGEYVRSEDPFPLLRNRTCPGDGHCIPILRIRPASEIRPSERFVDVAYRGDLYAVPLAGSDLNATSGRSSQTISLVQQLLNLHRSSRDLPATPLLRIQN